MIIKRIHRALLKAKEEAGTQKKLEAKTGVGQSSIAAFLNGKRNIGNMTVRTLEKLFPDMEIMFPGEQPPIEKNHGGTDDPVLKKLLPVLGKMKRKDLKELAGYIKAKYPDLK